MTQIQDVFQHYGVQVLDRTRQLVLCPLGHETHPSCSVDLDKGLWNCHSCEAAGDAISLIRMKEKCDYATAVRCLTEITGEGNSSLRGEHRPGRRVAPGKGYRPKYRRAFPARRRREP